MHARPCRRLAADPPSITTSSVFGATCVHLDAQSTLQDFELRIVLSEIDSDFGPMRRL
ncbi:hypothetical protein BQ8482_110473 [Mesorhizobium delmotii]|uniref:Uncharacterized protein n=1 Tax=Mesorhizobium delmotii TaxID=1631247 RepID=A0A2P9ABQ7_9HYPH|nr:hypothetical protein BQ8482_110473 [Mesorhizobium delmotii]